MQKVPIPFPFAMGITNEHDVVILRQTLRQLAREQGLPLTRQAKLSAAVTTVARALLHQSPSMTTTVTIFVGEEHWVLDVTMVIYPVSSACTSDSIEAMSHLAEARSLVDQAYSTIYEQKAELVLQIFFDRGYQ